MLDTRSMTTIVRYGIGFLALTMLGYGIVGSSPGTVTLLASGFLCLITCTDTLHGKIPNLATFTLLTGAICYHLSLRGAGGLQFALLGGLTGFLLLFLPYLLLGIGGGDLKALAALGSLLGPAATLQVFLFTGLIGGLLALLYMALAGRLTEKFHAGLAALQIAACSKCFSSEGLVDGPETRIRFPYAPAMSFGYCAFVQWGALV